MNEWNQQEISKQFKNTALNAEHYVKELKGRMKRCEQLRSEYECDVYDEHLAKFYVYDHLAYNNCLDSRLNLVAKIKSLLAGKCLFLNSCKYSSETFEKHWELHLRELMRQYGEQ